MLRTVHLNICISHIMKSSLWIGYIFGFSAQTVLLSFFLYFQSSVVNARFCLEVGGVRHHSPLPPIAPSSWSTECTFVSIGCWSKYCYDEEI